MVAVIAADPALDYAERVLAGEFPAGRLVRAACQRHLDDLDRAKLDSFPFRFDLAKSDRIMKFARMLHHYKGPLAGQAFEPDPFQAFILCSLFGWVRKSNGLRRFGYGYVEVPRKNGKTFLAAVVALYLLSLDGESGAEIYAAATKRDQAKIVWNDAETMARRSPALRGMFGTRYSRLVFDPLDATFEPLSSNSDKLDGLNPHGAINDELHAWTDRRLWEQIEDALGARTQPLIFSITTAGYDKNGICYEQRTHGESILTLAGYDDENTFVYIAAPDEGDEANWSDPKVWRQANPALGTAKQVDYLEKLAAKAKQVPSMEFAFKTKQLNIWTPGELKWLDMKRWEECGRGDLDESRLSERECYGGLDLSATTDFTASAYVFPPAPGESVWPVVVRLWIPEDTLRLREKRDRIPVNKWIKEGWIIPTSGDMVDLGEVVKEVKRDGAKFRIKEIGFDSWHATETARDLEKEGFDMVQMRQGFHTLAAPTKELELKVMRKELEHFGNPVLAWMASNTQVIIDSNGNMRPDKSKSANRIDGIVATIMALGRAINDGGAGPSIYETRGPLVL